MLWRDTKERKEQGLSSILVHGKTLDVEVSFEGLGDKLKNAA